MLLSPDADQGFFFATMKRFWIILSCFLFLVLVSWMLRRDILAGVGNFLICEDPIDTVDVVFVLGGSSYDRGNEAARLYEAGYIGQIICVGGNVPSILKVLNMDQPEAELTGTHLIDNHHIVHPDIVMIARGSSTMEEAAVIAQYCKDNGIQRAMVLSSKFHTRRIGYVMDKVFSEKEVEVFVRGAPSSVYSESEWWYQEEGLIMVNNEYVKFLYYLLKY